MSIRNLVIFILLTLAIVWVSFSGFPIRKDYTDRMQSAEKGIAWLIGQHNSIDPVTAIIFYKYIYKTISDDKLAASIHAAILTEESKVNTGGLPTSHPVHDWIDIEDMAIDLLNKKCSGIDIRPDVTRLRNIYLADKDQMMSEVSSSPAKIIATLYFLDKIGIVDTDTSNTATKMLLDEGPGSARSIYGLTHVIFTSSDYFSHYVSAGNFQREIGIFERTIPRYISDKPFTTQDVDLISEMIVSLKLLGQKDSPVIGKGIHFLMQLQNSDGSWGTPSDDKIHATEVAVLAIIDFPRVFRYADPFCLSH